MKYSEGEIGRVFVIRLEDHDRLPGVVESFAAEKGVSRGACILVGGIQGGGKIVAGPIKAETTPIVPMILEITGVHEIIGVGTLFPDEKGKPILHMHASLGRGEGVRTGCIRPGIEVWKVGEVILLEIKGSQAFRKKDPETGFELLEP